MAPRTCLCGLLPLETGCRAAGLYLATLYTALTALSALQLPRQAAGLHRVDAALANSSDPASPAVASLRGHHDALVLGVKLNVFEMVFFVVNVVAAAVLVAGAARRSRQLVTCFLCWFAPVTMLQGAALLLAVLKPVYGGVRACTGAGCPEAFALMSAMVALHSYLTCVVLSFLRELKQWPGQQGVYSLSVPADSEQQKGAVKYAFEN